MLLCPILVATGCAHLRDVPVGEEIADPRSRIHAVDGRSIAGYVGADSTYHEFRGNVRVVPPDSLVFLSMPGEIPSWPEGNTATSVDGRAIHEVLSLRISEPSHASNVVAIVLIVAPMIALAGLAGTFGAVVR